MEPLVKFNLRENSDYQIALKLLEVVSKPQTRFKGPRSIERGDGVLKPLPVFE